MVVELDGDDDEDGGWLVKISRELDPEITRDGQTSHD